MNIVRRSMFIRLHCGHTPIHVREVLVQTIRFIYINSFHKLTGDLQSIHRTSFFSLTKNSHMTSHMKPEFYIWNEKFHIWNWNFTCEIKISHMNYRISYMKPNNSYVKNYMWNRITYEFLDSYMKFLYVKTNHIWNLYVKTYHIWNPQFIYEILYVKTNHIWNLCVKTNHIWNSICENKSHMKPSIHI